MLAWRPGMVATYDWLKNYGVYPQLVDRYVKSGWLERLAPGVFIKPGDKPRWSGVVEALQLQYPQHVHIGGRSALEVRGYAHYGRLHQQIHLFTATKLRAPSWVNKVSVENATFVFTATNLFDETQEGISYQDVEGFRLSCSSLERAMLEMLAFIPQYYGYHEAAHLMQALKTLRPAVVQALLENCHSVKAKRLFLHLASLCEHSWLKFLDVTKIDLGSGVRKLIGGTVFDKQYQLYVPETQLNEGYTLDELRKHFP